MNGALRFQIKKELRALLPFWVGIVVVLGVSWCWQQSGLNESVMFQLQALGIGAYALGAVCLGALSIGHEFTHGTLPGLLAQPASRRHLFFVKAAVLTTLLAILSLVAVAAIPAFSLWRGIDGGSRIYWVPALCSLLFAPWLTMAGRGPLAGAVFAVALPIGLLVFGAWLGVPRGAAWFVMVPLAAVAGVMTWRTFIRLEATGDRQSEIELMRWRARPSERTERRARSRWVVLIAKELQLQQITFVLAGVFTGLWMAIWLVDVVSPALMPTATRYALTILYCGLVSMMAGALTSAEERRLGTHDWQLLLPVTNRAQWRIKVGVALSLSVLVACVLPMTLQWIAPDPTIHETFHPVSAVLLCIAALYVSSVSTSGVHATLATVPALALAAAIGAATMGPAEQLFLPLVRTLAEWVTPDLNITDPAWRWRWYPINGGALVGAVLMVAFAGVNHRSADVSRGRVLRQLAGFAALALLVLLALMMTEAILIEWQRLARAAAATGSGW